MGKKVWSYVWKAIIVVIVSGWTIFPIYWLFATSIKQHWEWTARPPVWFPPKPIIDNYSVMFTGELFMRPGGAYGEEGAITGAAAKALKYIIQPAYPQLINSLIIACLGTLIAIIVAYLAAYGISRYKTGGTFMYLFILTTRMFPAYGIAIPFVVIYSNLGLMDNRYALAAIYASGTFAFAVWMLRSFIDDIPIELEEAAMIDGCSRWGVIFKVTLPLVRGGLLAAALFLFILNWGEFLLASVFTYKSAVTAPVQLQKYFATSGYLYGPMAAQSILSIIPVVIFAYIIQKHLVRGLTFGAIKGS
ncbi:MAG: carbohydrate ABC transporter permease [Desulfobacteraceae bacterium]|nr:carbohydrate ABC transporter permease [Desulfobacteraceae bacterium]